MLVIRAWVRVMTGMYELISREFELSRRIALLNQKLDYTQELVQARRIQLKENKGTILTNWIIILIVACVILKCLDFYKRTPSQVQPVQDKGSWGLEKETTPLYRSMRIFREQNGWEDVFARVAAALIEFSSPSR